MRNGKSTSLRLEVAITSRGSGRNKTRRNHAETASRSRRLQPTRISSTACVAFAALGHPHRVRLLLVMLSSGATYADLRSASGLQPGPLYHHIQELRLAGLVGPKTRDTYELTRLGQEAALAAVALSAVWRKASR